jgi:dTDP-4-dehydrorhamnose reductase
VQRRDCALASAVPKLAIIGAGGRLGAALVREYRRDCAVRTFTRAELDLSDLDRLRQVIAATDFDLLINCAALTNVDYCESHREEALLINAEAPGVLAEVCRRREARLVHFSTDYVFDGKQSIPYREEDEPAPISVYGLSKLLGERAVLQVSERFLVIRVSWIFGPDRPSFVDQLIQRARDNPDVAAVSDKISTPTYTLDIAQALRAAWENSGLLHLTNEGACSWQEYGQHALDCCQAKGMELKTTKVDALRLRDIVNFVARRPVYTALSPSKFARLTGMQPRSWRDAVAAYVSDHVAKT